MSPKVHLQSPNVLRWLQEYEHDFNISLSIITVTKIVLLDDLY